MLAIKSTTDLLPGDIGFTVTPGGIGTAIAIAQAAADGADVLRKRGTSDNGGWFTHAFLVTEVPDGSASIIEAEPEGSVHTIIRDRERIGPGFGYVRLLLTDGQREEITQISGSLIGIPYGWLDYLSITALHLGLPRPWVQKRVITTKSMICSQLVDYALQRVGFHVFDDGRLPGDVTPGALFRQAGALGEAVWW